MGLERERIQMIFVSAAEGARFRDLATQVSNQIQKLGPSKLRKHQITAAKKAAEKARKAKAKGK